MSTGAGSTRQARARTTARPSARSSPATSSTDRPGRSSSTRTSTSPTGIAPRISQVSRAKTMPGEPARASSPASSAEGGPACWWPGSHGPRVHCVAAKRPPPSGT
jgi:hypothetical protein